MVWMLIFAAVFLALLCYTACQMTRSFQKVEADELEAMKDVYEQSLRRLEDLRFEKRKLQLQAEEIFTFYEVIKEITKSFDLEEAFGRFKQKLSTIVYFEDCRFVDSDGLKMGQSPQLPIEYSLLSLHSKERELGFLAVKGLMPQDQEKYMILAHQFALALRRIKLYQQVEHLALTDSLTEVQTRRYFMERFEEELKRSRKRTMQLSLLMIDVDHFKQFNDQYGHLTGDQVLHHIGRIIKENIREIDIAGRYGGEEFCVVLPDAGVEGAQFVAERIRATTAATPIKAYDHVINITVSIGIATFPQDGREISELLEKADRALYRAKALGRNRIFTDDPDAHPA